METVVQTVAGSDVADLQTIFPSGVSSKITKAYALAQNVYKDRLHPIGSIRLMEHVIGTLRIFAPLCPDDDAIISCLLQHSLFQGGLSLQALESMFGKNVRSIVSRIHLLSHVNIHDWRKSMDDLKMMLVSVSDDIRVVLLKLCIQSYLMEEPGRIHEEFRLRICRESLELFAPVAARLGIYALKYRLEDRAFPVAYPNDFERISQQLSMFHQQHGAFLPDVIAATHAFFSRESLQVSVTAREKHPYSIFQKMHRKSLTDISTITDLIAVRMVVPTLNDCYQALGLLHRIGTPVSHRFKDYISFPKPNGYQSLHTSLLGLPGAPKEVIIEVQIRTGAMHREAEYGIAAHWLYKSAVKKGEQPRTGKLKDMFARGAVDGRNPPVSADLAHLKLVDRMYVLTPKGDIIELPEGGTPLDFAFALHTELGLKFKAARVNGIAVPLTHRLENGDIVEIVTHSGPRPSLQWLKALATPSARSRLKAYFFAHHRFEFIDKGRQSLNAELKAKSLPPLDNDLKALKTFDGDEQSVRQREDLLVKIGMGAVKASSVLRHLGIEKPVRRKVTAKTVVAAKQGLIIDGKFPDMPYRFAKCCNIDPAKTKSAEIIGFITRGGGLTIHKSNCGMLRGANPARRVPVKWSK